MYAPISVSAPSITNLILFCVLCAVVSVVIIDAELAMRLLRIDQSVLRRPDVVVIKITATANSIRGKDGLLHHSNRPRG